MISTTSNESLAAGDECVVGVSGGAPPEYVFRIRCQSGLTSSSKTTVMIMVEYNSERRKVRPPDDGGAGAVV